MIHAATLGEMIEANRNAPRSITYLEGEHDSHSVSFAELYERAFGVLRHLQELGARPGDKVILYVANNEHFIDAFWACVLGGVIPVPVSLGISDEHRHKLLRIARALGAPFIYSDRRSFDRIGVFAANAGENDLFTTLRSRVLLVDELGDLSQAGTPYRADPRDVALIQFSSGSTSEPKGVVLTHANIIANWRGITQAARIGEDDVSMSWMPLTHDMGLIGFHIVMLGNRVHTHLMPTDVFIRRPLLWLSLASSIRATILCSPNFGYQHYLKALGDQSTAGLDLSAVRLIFNGGEPIAPALCDQFLTRLSSAKLARNAMFPAYGLAEASLAVAFPPVDVPLRILTVDRHRTNVGDLVEPVPAAHPNAIELVGEGQPIPYSRVRITGNDDQALPEGRIGHVQIAGDNVTRGYYENPRADADAVTPDGWLRTGDLGLFHEGWLYISGRAKEIIFVDGQNYYPHDIEAIAQRVPGIELGKVVAAGVRPRGVQTEQLVVFVLHRGEPRDFLAVAARVTRVIGDGAGVAVSEVVPVKRIPKTTSGKVQRHLLEQRYLDGDFDAAVAELRALRAAQRTRERSSRSNIEIKLKRILDEVLDGRPIDVDQNLFTIGATSRNLIEIHEQIDREYPGRIDLTGLFEFPTIAELAKHLERTLAETA